MPRRVRSLAVGSLPFVLLTWQVLISLGINPSGSFQSRGPLCLAQQATAAPLTSIRLVNDTVFQQGRPHGLALHPNGKVLVVTLPGLHQVAVVDASSGTVLQYVGQRSIPGLKDGDATAALFDTPLWAHITQLGLTSVTYYAIISQGVPPVTADADPVPTAFNRAIRTINLNNYTVSTLFKGNETRSTSGHFLDLTPGITALDAGNVGAYLGTRRDTTTAIQMDLLAAGKFQVTGYNFLNYTNPYPLSRITGRSGTGLDISEGYQNGNTPVYSYIVGLASTQGSNPHGTFIADSIAPSNPPPNPTLLLGRSIRLLDKSLADMSTVLVAGNGSVGGFDGPGAVATFNNITGIALDPTANEAYLYVSDAGNQNIRWVSTQLDALQTPLFTRYAKAVQTVVAPAGLAPLQSPVGLALSQDGIVLYIADSAAGTVYRWYRPGLAMITNTTNPATAPPSGAGGQSSSGGGGGGSSVALVAGATFGGVVLLGAVLGAIVLLVWLRNRKKGQQRGGGPKPPYPPTAQLLSAGTHHPPPAYPSGPIYGGPVLQAVPSQGPHPSYSHEIPYPRANPVPYSGGLVGPAGQAVPAATWQAPPLPYIKASSQDLYPDSNYISPQSTTSGQPSTEVKRVGGVPLAVAAVTEVAYSGYSDEGFPSVNGPAHPSGGARAASSGPVLAPVASEFSFQEMVRATNNFNQAHQLGEGSYGQVFGGTLEDGLRVAVKRMKGVVGGGDSDSTLKHERDFRAEAEIITRVHHKHLVKLVGYCCSGSERMLVFEFLPNKTLAQRLRGKLATSPLDWGQRYRIALGAAKGLHYLHDYCDPKIIHRDIKASNILLDANFDAKVADFGFAKSVPVGDTRTMGTSTGNVVGSFGYMAPECVFEGQRNSEKSDVYAFGVVLLELLTAKPPIDHSQLLMQDRNLPNWARTQAKEDVVAVIDSRLQGKYDPVEAELMWQTALACISENPASRPRMETVLIMLQDKMAVQYSATAGAAVSSSGGAATGGGAVANISALPPMEPPKVPVLPTDAIQSVILPDRFQEPR